MCSAAACSICWICIAIPLGLSENGGDSYVLGSVAVAFFFLFFSSFGLGVLGIPWLYPSEIKVGYPFGAARHLLTCSQYVPLSLEFQGVQNFWNNDSVTDLDFEQRFDR